MQGKLLINGLLVDGAGELEVVNPATELVFARCALADADQLDSAVGAAKAAFPAWADAGWTQRSETLCRLADAIEARQADFAALITAEQGKPIDQARTEALVAAAAFRFFSATPIEDAILVDEPECLVIEKRVPLGVVAVITPWNFPLILLAVKTAAALATGNTVVAKPAPTTPLSALLLGELVAPILPPGVFNVIVDRNDLGPLLTAHPDVAKVTFTGSTATGKRVMQSAASSMKRLTLELGGNDAAIVLDDVDVAALAPAIFSAAMFNSGQVCTAAKRVYVPRARFEEWASALSRLAEGAVVGDGSDDTTTIGPVQNREQFEKVLGFIEDARQQGIVIAGGERLDRSGYFVRPTIVRDLPDDARLVAEEQFGPVMPLLAYDTIDEVVARANASEFGLAGSIWGADLERAVAVASRIESGTVWVNKHLDMRFDVPFGGSKQSGLGREQGVEGLREFTQPRVVNIARAAGQQVELA